MKSIHRGMFGALLAVVSLGALAVASASAALPELVNSRGEALVKRHITSTHKAGTPIVLETVSHTALVCSGISDVGEVSGRKRLVNVAATFTGCEEPSLKYECKTSGAHAGELRTTTLEGELGYVSKEAKTVGLELWPSSRKPGEREKHEFNQALVGPEFYCGSLGKNEIKGAVVGQMAPTNTLITPPATLAASYVQIRGAQGVTKLDGVEGGVAATLQLSFDGGAFEPLGLEATSLYTLEEAAEIRA